MIKAGVAAGGSRRQKFHLLEAPPNFVAITGMRVDITVVMHRDQLKCTPVTGPSFPLCLHCRKCVDSLLPRMALESLLTCHESPTFIFLPWTVVLYFLPAKHDNFISRRHKAYTPVDALTTPW